ncbi:universal stress protein [Lentzea sp. NPDC003310]|uniref:universal stress protein n=1 Tax=Lentzea sp. NPDC003310 TaxID=3154447 RepID=UPI0033AFB621
MHPVVIIQDGARRDENALRWAAAHAQLIGTGLEIHRPHDDFRAQLVVAGHRLVRPPAHCDMVVVRGTPAAVDSRHRLVTALVSGGPGDGRVLRHAADFARLRGARLRVLHATSSGEAPDHVLARASAVLGSFAHRTVLVQAEPHEAVARCTDSDLVVVGSGSVFTTAALHHAPCPVLVVRQPVLEHFPIAVPAPRRPARAQA